MTFLEGVRVLDASRVLAGPLAAQTLADLGAEVLKIEPPGGDDTRRWGPPFQAGMAAYYQSCNRNKKSLVLDLKDPPQKERLYDLVRAADIWIDNYPPRVAKRLGLTPNELLRLNPELVALTITGYSGERVDEPGYDIMIQAESGLMGITGPAAGAPHKTGVAIVDVLTGLMAANGVLAALFRRERRGKGARLAISLHQTALYSLVNVATNYLVSGEPSARWGNAHANIVPYQDFQLADRSVIIGVGNDRQFHRLCKLLHIQDPALTELDNRGRVQQRDRVLDAIRQKLSGQKADPLLKRLREAQIPAAPILRPDEALARVPTWNAQSLLAVEHPTVGTVKLVANPLTGAGIREQHQAPPQLDEGGRELAECWLKNPMWRG